ncbi:MAG: beta-galactosidase trimerization domain-containing protein [Candidatus Limivivens sp.]|nr:beta-galactosidase trimerization domain-containing protein [Candidatus Limivivens sp.]
MKPINSGAFSYVDYQSRLFSLLGSRGYEADVISFDGNFADYPVVIVPTAFVMSRKIQKKLETYVRNGGTLIATFLTSAKDECNTGYTDSLPAGLTEVFGVTVEEVDPVYEDNRTALRLINEEPEAEQNAEFGVGKDHIWSELLQGEAKPLGIYTEDYKTGKMVISSHRYGRGRAVYLGTDLPDEQMGELLCKLAKEAGAEPLPMKLPAGTQAFSRRLDGKEFFFLFNFSPDAVTIPLCRPMRDFLKEKPEATEVRLEKNGFAVLSGQ